MIGTETVSPPSRTPTVAYYTNLAWYFCALLLVHCFQKPCKVGKEIILADPESVSERGLFNLTKARQ